MRKSYFKDSKGKTIKCGDALEIYDPKDYGPRHPLIVGKVREENGEWFVDSWPLGKEMAENSFIIKEE